MKAPRPKRMPKPTFSLGRKAREVRPERPTLATGLGKVKGRFGFTPKEGK